jgi:ribosome biogenesis protein MAK21
MAKHNNNPGKVAKITKSTGTAKSASKAQKLPAFDEGALSALTEKIEKGFQKATASTPNKKGSPDSLSKSLKTTPRSTGGKKRDAQGNVKPADTSKQNKSSKSETKKAKSGAKTVDRDVLLQEILALGGTEEDLDLIVDVESDSDELEDDNKESVPDLKFAKEFSKFVAGLGIEGQGDEEPSDAGSEEDGPEDDAEQWEDVSVKSAEKSAIATPAPILKTESKTTKQSNDPNRLVSISFNLQATPH